MFRQPGGEGDYGKRRVGLTRRRKNGRAGDVKIGAIETAKIAIDNRLGARATHSRGPDLMRAVRHAPDDGFDVGALVLPIVNAAEAGLFEPLGEAMVRPHDCFGVIRRKAQIDAKLRQTLQAYGLI